MNPTRQPLDLTKQALSLPPEAAASRVRDLSGRNAISFAQLKTGLLGVLVGLTVAFGLTRLAVSKLPAPQEPIAQFEAQQLALDTQEPAIRKAEQQINDGDIRNVDTNERA